MSLPALGVRAALRLAFCVAALTGLSLAVACSLSPQPLPPGETVGPTPLPKEPAADAAPSSIGAGAPSTDASAPDSGVRDGTADAGDAGVARDAGDASDASDAPIDAPSDSADGSRE